MVLDPLYIIFMVATLVVSGGAQLYIRSTYGRWSRVANGAGLSGAQVAEYLRDHADVRQPVRARGDHGDQGRAGRPVRPFRPARPLAWPVGGGRDAAVGRLDGDRGARGRPCAAGRRGQRADAAPLDARAGGQRRPEPRLHPDLRRPHPEHDRAARRSGSSLFGIAVLFSLLTLPVEIQASRKALAMLDATGVVTTQQDRDGRQGRC